MRAKVWLEGSRADIPAIPDLNPNRDQTPRFLSPDVPMRGEVTEFSNKSRRRFIRVLSTIKRAEIAFTMALTLPGGDISSIGHDFVMKALQLDLSLYETSNQRPETYIPNPFKAPAPGRQSDFIRGLGDLSGSRGNARFGDDFIPKTARRIAGASAREALPRWA
ncbi:MAG: hypothetical protein QM680_09525 [Luteolibacter sp.]